MAQRPSRAEAAEASRPPFPDSNAPHGPFSAKANSMDIDDKRDVNGEFLARRLTLVRGEARELAPYRAEARAGRQRRAETI